MNVNNIPMVIGLAGRKGAGKTTLSELLLTSVFALSGGKLAAGPIAFAEPLKHMTATLLLSAGIRKEALPQYLEGGLKEKPIGGSLGGITPRHIMQTLGTEWGRSISSNLWVDIAEGRIKGNIDEYNAYQEWTKRNNESSERAPARPVVIVTDVRFPNEIEMIRKLGGKVFWISRAEGEARDGHASEMSISISDCDAKIDNNGYIHVALGQLLEATGFYHEEQVEAAMDAVQDELDLIPTAPVPADE